MNQLVQNCNAAFTGGGLNVAVAGLADQEAGNKVRNITVEPPGWSPPVDDIGVFLTWEDLWVTVSNGKKKSKSILQELTGCARPGEVLAILGPSGCGKSTLLDTLAGKSYLASNSIYLYLFHR